MRKTRTFKIAANVCRLILACTFIVSGFTKVIDPWGTALKVNEYLSIYGLDYLQPGAMVFSIWLCGAELMMGCMLLFKVRIRLISIFAVLSMVFFTLLTLLSATLIPVEDCGCFGEALKTEFKEYQLQVKKNAAALAAALQKQGFKILTGGTDNHLMLVDLRGMDISGKELQNRCDEVYITLNKNTVPNDPRSPFVTSGVRIGTPAVTTRGLKEEDMEVIAECIWLAATDFENKADYIRAEVTKLCEKYPLYK